MRIRAAWAALALVACQSQESPVQPDGPATLRTAGGIEYSVDTRVMESFPVQIAVDVTVTNRSGAPVILAFPDSCVVTLRAYRDGELVWDQRALILCLAAITEVELEPGASRTFATRTDAGEILQGNLPDGSYRLEAVLHPTEGTVRLDAGIVDLAIARDGTG